MEKKSAIKNLCNSVPNSVYPCGKLTTECHRGLRRVARSIGTHDSKDRHTWSRVYRQEHIV